MMIPLFLCTKGYYKRIPKEWDHFRGYAKKALSTPAKVTGKVATTVASSTEKDKMPTPSPVLPFQKIPRYACQALSFSLLQEPQRPDFFSLSSMFQAAMKAYEYPKQLFKEFKLFDQKNLLARKETVDLIHRVVHADDAAKRVIYLDGPAGVGKSSMLLQLVNVIFEARSHCIIYIPDAHQLTLGRFPYYRSSDLYPGMSNSDALHGFLQPELAQFLLGGMLAMNAPHFEQGGAMQHVELELSHLGVEKTLQLKSALEQGMAEQLLAVPYFMQIMDFFFSAQCPVPVLFAVDQVNALSASFEYFDTESKRLTVQDMPVLLTLDKYFDAPSSTLKPGSAVIGATSYTDTRIWSSQLKKRLQESLVHEVVSVSPFTKEETRGVLEYYRALGLLYEDAVEGNYCDTKYYVSGGNGRKLFLSCSLDNIY